jgi:hypothetical protein
MLRDTGPVSENVGTAPPGRPAAEMVMRPTCAAYTTAAGCATRDAVTVTVRVAGVGANETPLALTAVAVTVYVPGARLVMVVVAVTARL